LLTFRVFVAHTPFVASTRDCNRDVTGMTPVILRIGAGDQELLATLGVRIVTAGPGALAEKRCGLLVLALSAVLVF
jgi:hypothetical protein